MESVNNLYLINNELLIYKQNNKFIPEITSNVTSVLKLDNFEIDSNGNKLIVFLLKTKSDISEQISVLIFQEKSNGKFIQVFPENLNLNLSYYVYNLQIIEVPNINLKNISIDKKKLFQELATKYSKEIIDSNLMSQILEISIVLTDNNHANQLILDKLELHDLINLSLLSPENKNKVNHYILNKLKTEYDLDLQKVNLGELQPIKLYEQIIKLGLTHKLADWAKENGHLQVLIWLAEPPRNILPNVNGGNRTVLSRQPQCHNLSKRVMIEDSDNEFDLSSTKRSQKFRRYFQKTTCLSYLILQPGTLLYRGFNPKQKTNRPQFFAFNRVLASRYGDVATWETTRVLRVLETHYPIELEECCSRNAMILQVLAKELPDSRQKDLILLAIGEHLLKEVPEVAETMALDSALAQFVCSLKLDGWIRLNQTEATDETMICDPADGVRMMTE